MTRRLPRLPRYRKARRAVHCAVAVLLAVTAPGAVTGAGLFPEDRRAGSIEAELHVARDDYDLQAGAAVLDTRASRVGIAMFEAVRPALTLGFAGGVVSVSQSGRALTAGMRLRGEYLALMLRSAAMSGRRWRLGFGAGMLYQSVEDETPDQRVEIDWVEAEARVELVVDVTGDLSLYAGSVYTDLRGDQRARGAVTSTDELAGHERGTATGGLSLEVDPGGYVTLAVRRGARDGFTVRFRRVF